MKIQVKHIQIDLNPQEYRAICEQGTITDIQKLPKYTLARCPLCGAEYVGHIDTYSLQTWRRLHPEIHGYVYRNIYEYKQCSHFVAVQTFLNLNNNIPTEIPYLANGNGDVPIITPELFIDEFDASAVIHSLPICRIENEQFVPRYAIYVITYYSTNPTETRNQAMTSLYADAENVHWGTLFDSSDRMVTEPMVGKLAEWAKQGKLHWLDLHDSALPLVNTRIAEFPYDQIDGFGQPFIYRKRPKPRWFWQRRNWSPDGEIRDWSEKQLLR